MMNNVVYGKTMQNLRKIIDVKFAINKKKYLKCKSKPNYVSQKIFDCDSVAIPKIKVILKLNKPAYVGMCGLDMSKVLMYDDVYEDFSKNKEMFDFSN